MDVRFNTTIFQREFVKFFPKYQKKINQQQQMIDILDDRGFLQLLRIFIDCGNILNTNQKKGKAYAVRVLSLQTFFTVKTKDKSNSLVDYIVQEVMAQDKSLLDFLDPLVKLLKNCTLFNISDLISEI